jgi:hypothetical protein
MNTVGDWWSEQVMTRVPAVWSSVRMAAWLNLLRASGFSFGTSVIGRLVARKVLAILQSPLGLVASALIFVGVDFALGNRASSPDTGYLAALWAVDATVITVAAAVLLFVLQTYVGRTPASLRVLVQDSSLIPFLYVGGVALLVLGVDGLIKSSFVSGAVLSAGVFAWLVPVFVKTIRIVSAYTPLDQAINALAEARESRRYEIQFEAAASQILSEHLATAGIARAQPALMGFDAVRLRRRGYVRDLRLGLVNRLNESHVPGAIALTVEIGSRVTPDTIVGYVTSGSPPRIRRRLVRSLVIQQDIL